MTYILYHHIIYSMSKNNSKLLLLLEGEGEWAVDIAEELGISRRAIEIAIDAGATEELAKSVLVEGMLLIDSERCVSSGIDPDRGKEIAMKAASKIIGKDSEIGTAIQINLGGFDVGKVV